MKEQLDMDNPKTQTILDTRHRMTTNKAKYKTHKNKTISNTQPNQIH